MSMVLFFNCIFSQNSNKLPQSIHIFNTQDIYGEDFDFNFNKCNDNAIFIDTIYRNK